MKGNTLLAVGVAGALAWGASSAATFLCTKDPSDVSSLSCAKAPPEERVYGPSAEPSVVPSSAFVEYYLMAAAAAEELGTLDRTPVAKLRAAPEAPRVSYYSSSAESDGSE